MALSPQDLLQKGSDWLEAQRTAHTSKAVLYARGAASVGIQASIGRTEFQVDDGSGVMIQDVSRDFIVLAADLALGSANIEPQRGDRITESINGRVFVYEVSAPGGQQPWRWSDPFGTSYRIHTKRVQS